MVMIKRIGLDRLISAKRTRERDVVLAMIVERLIWQVPAPLSELHEVDAQCSGPAKPEEIRLEPAARQNGGV